MNQPTSPSPSPASRSLAHALLRPAMRLWRSLRRHPRFTRFEDGRSFCGDDSPHAYCGKPRVRACDYHDELWMAREPRELERLHSAARAVAHERPAHAPQLTKPREASLPALFENLYAARRFLRDLEAWYAEGEGRSMDTWAMYERARQTANAAIDELDRRGVPIEDRCPQCGLPDGIHAGSCPRLACEGCGPDAPLPGVRFPALAEGAPEGVFVERCDACAIFETDLEAAAALAELRRPSATVPPRALLARR